MFEPSTPIAGMLTAVASTPAAAEGLRMMTDRAADFPHLLAAQLTGIALDPAGRELADRFLDNHWSDEQRRRDILDAVGGNREVIIGSGYHAAVYAATRVLAGFPKPLVLERGPRIGGTFAMTTRPVFYLNSRNRPGGPGLAGDQSANLNFLPGAPIQAANVSMTEYQTNTDMAFVIRLALALVIEHLVHDDSNTGLRWVDWCYDHDTELRWVEDDRCYPDADGCYLVGAYQWRWTPA